MLEEANFCHSLDSTFAFLPVQWPVINQAYVNIARIVVLICTIWQGIIVASPIMPHLCTHFIFHYFLTVLSLWKWSLFNGARYDKKESQNEVSWGNLSLSLFSSWKNSHRNDVKKVMATLSDLVHPPSCLSLHLYLGLRLALQTFSWKVTQHPFQNERLKIVWLVKKLDNSDGHSHLLA